MPNQIEKVQKQIHQIIQQNAKPLNDLAKKIHANPELGFAETKACRWQVQLLRKWGFSVKTPFAECKTGYQAIYKKPGKASPTFAFMAEYDALPEIGHGCGHNLICIAAIAAALAVGKTLKDQKLHYSPSVSQEAHYVSDAPAGGSEVDVPLLIDDELIGVLVVESQEENAFGTADFEILTAAAQQAAYLETVQPRANMLSYAFFGLALLVGLALVLGVVTRTASVVTAGNVNSNTVWSELPSTCATACH